MRPSASAITPKVVTATVAPPAAIAALGGLLLVLAHTQPAWVSGRIGPGLFAQWLSMGVVALSLLWFAASLAGLWLPRRHGLAEPEGGARFRGRTTPGLALLTAVALFPVLMPVAGLVAACAVTAAVAGWGAGDRGLRALAASALLAGMVAAGIGLTLLPPTTRLWPWGPF
ncbi:hypothetical protein [Pelagibius sp.]|uniref:hypothetical protein n=1 Tax=Pelagibius sp. TaxID=1931238 RepID=UPI0026062DE0|nr:hypothetical protein [Pelagibius sp.]